MTAGITTASNTAIGSKPARSPELDGLRGIAILQVLIYHYFVNAVDSKGHTLTAYAARRLSLSWSGVDLFLVLSGFLIGGILIDNKEATNYYGIFYLRRACRIVPLYFAWIGAFVAVTSLLPGLALAPLSKAIFADPLPIWSYLTFTQNIVSSMVGMWGPQWFAVTWSLGVEEQFYIVIPVIVRLVPLKRLPYVLVLGILSAPIIRITLYTMHRYFPYSTYMLMPCRADALLLGVLAAYLLRRDAVLSSLRDNTRSLYYIAALLTAGAAILTITPADIGTYGTTYFGYTWLAALYCVVLVIALTERQGFISTVLKMTALRKLGNIAFGVYLFHQTINRLCHWLILNESPHLANLASVMTTLLALLITLSLAQLSFLVYERRFLSFAHRFRYIVVREHQVATVG